MKIFLVTICLLILLFSACDRNEIKELRQENKELKETLELIQQELDNFNFSTVIVERSNSVETGEKYEAMVGLVISNTNSPILVQLATFENNRIISFGDTLKNCFGEFCIYENTRFEIGQVEWGGRILFDFFDREIERLFDNKYEVTE